jgi:hypothetical protein
MTNDWKSGDKKSNNNLTDKNEVSKKALTNWSRQQKIAMVACFGLLGLLLIVSACSKQSAKPALVAVSSPAAVATATLQPTLSPAALPPPPATPNKKVVKKRPANVTYNDDKFGVSFVYPRKFSLIPAGKNNDSDSNDDKMPVSDAATETPMNFVQPGGVTVAAVAIPAGAYPGTDFASGFFTVNVNRSVSEQECQHFAFVDTRNEDGEPVDAEKVKIGSTDMEMTSDFTANVMKQEETQYYHSFENGSCYEYVVGLATQGFGTDGVEHVDRDAVFAKLGKILATVKVKPVEPQQVAEQASSAAGGGKE